MKRNKLKLNWKSLLISLLIFIASCANVPDVPICAEINMSKGKCSYTLSGKKITVDDDHLLNGETWFDLRSHSLTMPVESWAQLKAWILKMCKKYKCDAEIATWDRSIDTVDSAVNKE